MVGDLRSILLALGLPAIGLIWWWTARRSGQAPGNAELRESTSVGPQSFTPPPVAAEPREWGVPPLEPLSIRTAEFERVPALEEPMSARPEPLDLHVEIEDLEVTDEKIADERIVELGEIDAPDLVPAAELELPYEAAPAPVLTPAPNFAPPPPRAPASVPTLVPRASVEQSDRHAPVAPQSPNASERQRIVSVRVCAVGEGRWTGTALKDALELHGLAYGRYQVYHRKHSDGRSIFCVASLVEPGTFDMARMAEEEFRGVTLFAVLPGPLEPLQTVDALLTAARDLARELSGTVQDAKGVPLSPQRALALREDVARFQAQLT
jgi:cell division protein ZipA